MIPDSKITADFSRRKFRWGSVNRWYEAFILLNFLDVVLTLYFLRHGGFEANPIGQFVLSQYGWPVFVSFKFLQCVIILLIVGFLYHRRRMAGRMLIALACLCYFVLMFWDVYLLLRLPR